MIEKSNIAVVEMAGDTPFRHFFLCNPTPMWFYDVESLFFLSVNKAAINAYGYSEEQFLSMTIRDIRPKEDVRKLEQYLANNSAASQESSMWRHLAKDGRTVWAKVSSFCVLYNGRRARMATVDDITQTVEQSIALAKANQELEKLSLVAKLTGNAVMILDAGMSIIWVNDAFTGLTGYTFAEVAGKTPSALLQGPQSSMETKTRIQRAIVQRKPFSEEIVQYSKAGKPCWILVDGQPVPHQECNPAEYIIVETDITELKEKEAAIEASKIQMNVFFEGTDSMHILFDTELKVLTYNKVAEDFVQKKLDGSIAIGGSIPDTIPESIRHGFLHFATKALDGRPTTNREIGMPLGNLNELAWWIISYIPAYDCFGKIMGVAFTACDITERKKSEEKINRQKKVFTEIAWKQSHLVRAPLANIMSLTCLLQTEGSNPVLLTALEEESKKLDNIITGIVHKTLEER